MRWLFCLMVMWPALVRAEYPIEVDVELFLAVDVSRSMSPAELEIQRRGYAEALTSDPVLGAIGNGLLGRVALTYVEWAGQNAQREIVPWTLIENPEDAAAFSARITAHFEDSMRRTSISGALLYAAESFENNGFHGLRRVIDISGDGPNNQGRPVPRARDSVLAKGFVINGLPLMTNVELEPWDIPDLDLYYRDCVIGGPGAFMVPVYDWADFPAAIRRKLVLEISGGPVASVLPAQYRPTPQADCLAGEKIWEQYRRYWESP